MDTKLQIGCFLLSCYILIRYTRLKKLFATPKTSIYFSRLLVAAVVETIFDALAAHSVNDPYVSPVIKDVIHLFFYLSLDTLMYCTYAYFLTSFPRYEESRTSIGRYIVDLLYLLNMLVVALLMPTVQYIDGEYSNYSYGLPVSVCFAMAVLYILLLLIKLMRCWSQVEGVKRANAVTLPIVLAVVTVVQYFFPELLITSIASAFVVVSGYINMEDPIRCQAILDNELMQEQIEIMNKSLTVKRNKRAPSLLKGNCKRRSKICNALPAKLELSSTTRDRLEINPSELVYIESIGNYVNIYLWNGETIVRKQLRQTMKVLVQELVAYPIFIRIHRAYVANLDKVIEVIGSSRGYFLLLENVKYKIPVSRNYIADLNEAIGC